MANSTRQNPLLDESFLEKLEQLRIIAQRRIRNGQFGAHLSWRHGENLEFEDYRNYYPGDDIRYVDWNVYGRLDRLFIKLFQSEKDFNIHIIIDTSHSMAFGDPPKDIQAKKIAAALAYIGLANDDRVGVSAFNDILTLSRMPEKGKRVYHSVLDFLLHIQPQASTNFHQSINEFIATQNQAGLVVIISDLLDPKGLWKGLKAINNRKFDPVVIQILDQQEIAPELNGYLKLIDMENGQSKRLTVSPTLLNRYQRKMEQYLQTIRHTCSEMGIEYFFTESHVPFEEFLLHFLINARFLK